MFALDGFVPVGCNAVCARVATLLGVTALEASQFTERSLPTKISAFPTPAKASFPWPTRDQTRCVVIHVVFRRRILTLHVVFGTLNCWRIISIPWQTHNKAFLTLFFFDIQTISLPPVLQNGSQCEFCMRVFFFILIFSSLYGAFYDIFLTYLNQFIVLHLFCS